MSTFLRTERPTYQPGTKHAEKLAAAKIGDLLAVRFEEEAIVWLWHRPSLLPWPRTVEWLFSPVTGKEKWPGDLWGIDEDGELLIIENKQFKGSGGFYDPFTDFCDYKREAEFCTADALSKKWSKLYDAELKFGKRLSNTRCHTPGILPNSCHCACLKYWPKLARGIETRIRPAVGKYARTVMQYPSYRAAKGNPRPHYCGLLVKAKEQVKQPLAASFDKQRKLVGSIGSSNVHLFVTSAKIRDGNSVAISVTETPDIILKIGGEGGDFTLYGDRTGGGWVFSLSVNDCSPLMLDEEEPAIQHTSSCATSWAGAIALLDKHPWAKLYPLAVHADFRKHVWDAVESRLCNDPRYEAALDNWRRACRK